MNLIIDQEPIKGKGSKNPRSTLQPADTQDSLAFEILRCQEADAINQEHCQAHDVNRLTY